VGDPRELSISRKNVLPIFQVDFGYSNLLRPERCAS
jgi:hypothetical protein